MRMSEYTPPKGADKILRLKMAQCIAERKPHESMVKVAERAGVASSTLFRCMKQEDFRELVKSLTDDMLVQYMPQVDKSMLKLATGWENADGSFEKPSVGAAQYLAQRGGRTEIGTRDKGFDDFLKKLDSEDREALEHYQREGYWPEDEATIMAEPEREQ